MAASGEDCGERHMLYIRGVPASVVKSGSRGNEYIKIQSCAYPFAYSVITADLKLTCRDKTERKGTLLQCAIYNFQFTLWCYGNKHIPQRTVML